MKSTKPIFFLTLLCLLFGCGGYQHPTFPNEPVNFDINPNEITYQNLNWAGGSEYFTGGVNGIVVFRIDDWTFSAFDRACPHDWDLAGARINVEPDGLTLRCPRCNSLYNILDGSKIFGPSKYPLKPYFTKFDGMRLRVHS